MMPDLPVELVSTLLQFFAGSLTAVTAIVVMFWRDKRLRFGRAEVIYAFLLNLIAIIVLTINLSLRGFGYPFTWFSLSGIVIAIAGYMVLVHLLLAAYARIFLFRDSGFLKYLGPFNALRKFSDRTYVLTMGERKDFVLLPFNFPKEAIETIKSGYSFLMVGPRICEYEIKATTIASLAAALEQGETIDYVCIDQHPFRIKDLLKDELKKSGIDITNYYGTDIIIIDAFTPLFGFREDILDEERRRTQQEIPIIEASSLAGLHRAAMKAWYMHKQSIQLVKARSLRRANRMVYDNLSTFIRFEGLELLTTFYHHMISAERGYKMITIIIEYNDTDSRLIATLEGLVDGVIRFSKEEGVTKIQISKMRNIDLTKIKLSEPFRTISA